MPSVNTEKSRDASSGSTDKSNASTASISTVGATVSSVCKAVVAELPTVSLVKVAATMAARSAQAQPNALRSRTATQYTNERGNKPATFIEVARMPTGGSGTAATAEAIPVKFNDFFITDCQEQDAEKAEVAETFGAPHVFASGRYMRKVSIQGVCRTGPLNPEVVELTTIGGVKLLSDEDYARYLVPQTLGLRVLYDKLLRASELISRGLFARLHVDGEVYSGWFTTLNIARNANEEAFAHFTSSMLVFSRYHKDETWAEKLVPSNLVGGRGALGDTTAAAVLADMVGKMDLSLSTDTATVKGNIEESKKTGYAFAGSVALSTKGTTQPILVSLTLNDAPLGGFRIGYLSGKDIVPLAGATIQGGSTVELCPIVTSYQEIRKALMGDRTDSGSPIITGNVIAVFSTHSGGTSATLNVTIQIDTRLALDIQVLSIKSTMGSEHTERAADLFTSTTVATAAVRLSIGVKNGATPDDLELRLPIAGIVIVSPDGNTKGPDGFERAKISTGGSVPSVEDLEVLKSETVQPRVTADLLSTESPGVYSTNVSFDFSGLATAGESSDLRLYCPLKVSSDLRTDFAIEVQSGGFMPSRTGPMSVTATYNQWVRQALGSTFTMIFATNGTVIIQLPTNGKIAAFPVPPAEVVAAIKELLLRSTIVFTSLSGTLNATQNKIKDSLRSAKYTTVEDGVLITASSDFLSATSTSFGGTTVVSRALMETHLHTVTFKCRPTDSAQSPTYTKR